MLTLVKLGGSLITDKRVEASFRADVMDRLATEIRDALRDEIKLIIGHGSGSFGHFAAQRHNTINGVRTLEQWRGFAEVATIAAQLNNLVAKSLHEHDVPVWCIQPSASIQCENGIITTMATQPLQAALNNQLVPLLYGDVALDTIRGGTIISTETIFAHLVHHFPVNRILLLGEVDGVYDAEKRIIPHITSDNIESFKHAFGGSEGTDVTGGMYTKVLGMLALTRVRPDLQIRIMNGKQADLLRRTLLEQDAPGTLITL